MIILDMDLFSYLVKQAESIKYDDIRECIVSNLDIIKVGVQYFGGKIGAMEK